MPVPCSGEEMAPQPVTLRVKIYKQTYNVTYPSQQRVEDLKKEFATMAKGGVKPCGNRKFFLCIYCGKNHYSNKMMLNKHRFVEGCDEAKYPDGKKALLLPYPDFRTGEGKKVEVLGKSVAVLKNQDKPNVDSDGADDDLGVDGDDCDDFEADLVTAEGCEKANEVKGSFDAEPHTFPRTGCSIPQDFLFKGTVVRIGSASATRLAGTEKPTVAQVEGVEAQKAKKITGKKAKGVVGKDCANRGSPTLNPGSGVNISKKNSKTESRRSPRLTSAEEKKGSRDVSPQIRAVEKMATPELSPHREGRMLSTEGISSPMFCDTNLAQEPEVSGDGADGFGRDKLKRKACSDDDLETFKVFVRDPLLYRKLKLPRSTTNSTSEVGISSGKLTVGAESQCHTGCHNVTGSSLDGVSVIPTGPSTPAISEDPTYATIPKSDGWSRNAELRQFWADGMGRPHPLSYHPDVEVAHQRGLADFKRAEDEYIEKNCPSEESLQVQIPPPVCPLKPRMPGLYYLKEIGAEVDLPWTWECSSGDKFVEKWELSLMCTNFKLKLMRCVYWWTCRKGDRKAPLPADVIEAVSVAIDGLVFSVEEGTVYKDLEGLRQYIQWTQDYSNYELALAAYRVDIVRKRDDMLESAIIQFRSKNGKLREASVWHWCPMWQILTTDEGIMQKLPSLPWVHDVREAQEVRRILYESRVNPRPPSHFVYIMRILFRNKHGIFRQFTCPFYGITSQIFRSECRELEDVMKALSMLISEGPSLFATLSVDVKDPAFRELVCSEIQFVNSGLGDDIVSNLVAWVRLVQLRALQDFAVCQPKQFQEAWTTTDPNLWAEHYSNWRSTLRVREERDVGWILSGSITSTNPLVSELRLKLQDNVHSMTNLIREEDEKHWGDCTRDMRVPDSATSPEPLLNDSEAGQGYDVEVASKARPSSCDSGDDERLEDTVTVTDIVTTTDSTAEGEIAVEEIGVSGGLGSVECDIEVHDGAEPVVRVTDFVTETDDNDYVIAAMIKDIADVVGKCDSGDSTETELCNSAVPCVTGGNFELQATTAANANLSQSNISAPEELGHEAMPEFKRDQKDTVDFIREKGKIITPVVADLHSTGVSSTQAVFPEIDTILDEDLVSPGAAPLLTLSQFNNSAHAGQDVVVENGTFSQDPSFHHWVRDDVQNHVQTPYKGVSIVAGQENGHLGFADEATTCRNLAQSFEDEEDLEAVSQLVNLSQAAERDTAVGPMRKPATRSRNLAKNEVLKRGAHSLPDLCLIQVGEIGVLTLAQAYTSLNIEDLLRKIPGREGKKDPADVVVFYNESRKEIEVKFSNIRDLKRLRTRLGNDIVDFTLSRMYYQYPARTRHEIQFLTSRVSSCYMTVAKGMTTLKKWASVFLQPPSPVRIYQVKELLLPWVTANHWSLLVFQYDRVLHFDSFPDSELHVPGKKHADFVNVISHSWQTLRGVELYDVPVVSQSVFHQKGTYECGHHTLRNAMLYLKFRGHLSVDREESLATALTEPFKPKDISLEILTLLARELDFRRRDTRYRPPLCVVANVLEADVEPDGDIVMLDSRV